VQELNTYIGYKKATQAQLQARNNLFDGATTSKAAEEVDSVLPSITGSLVLPMMGLVPGFPVFVFHFEQPGCCC
jgi:hypothetical protein